MNREGRELPLIGIYEHYKSTPENERFYRITGFARHTETLEALVLYLPLYIIPDLLEIEVQARPLNMFMEEVEYNGKILPRYRYIGPEIS